jgi:predicted phosphodiesterase
VAIWVAGVRAVGLRGGVSPDAQCALGIEELPDDDPLIEALKRPAEQDDKGVNRVLLWILSDIHVELTRGWDLPPPGKRPRFDIMIIAGNLIPRMERGVRWLLERVTDRPVLYVPGNHEAYGTDIDRTVEKARQAAAGTNVRILQNDTETMDDYLFAGATLWTDFELFGNRAYAMNRAGDVMNDYLKIRKRSYTERLRPIDTVTRHHESREFIARTIRETSARRKVVITHHGCVLQAIPKGKERDIISAAYVSDCPELLDGVDMWVYGHTHESREFRVCETRIVSNAKGYGPWRPFESTWENESFNPNYIVEI